MSKIFVTKPSLPDIELVFDSLKDVWSSRILTNGGKFSTQFESDLKDYLGCKYVCLYSNATMALFAILQLLEKKGGVITSPYTFVATTNAIILSGNTPVFVDIDPNNFCLNASLIEDAIDSSTIAILPVYTYGFIPDLEKMSAIASKHNLLFVSDAAHSFGVKPQLNKFLTDYGDATIFSFHATKVFNTFEGGAIATNSLELKTRLDQFKNFGIVNEESIDSFGLNCKMSEFNSIIGIHQLNQINNYINRRKIISKKYTEIFEKNNSIKIPKNNVFEYNYSYYPILVESNIRDKLFNHLMDNNVLTRKYFYPLVTDYAPYVKKFGPLSFDIADNIADQVICLPIYPDLLDIEQDRIIKLIVDFIG